MKRYLAIDIGGSSVKHAVIDEALNLEHQGTVPAPRESLEQFVDCIGALYDPYKEQIEGIAISLAGTINPQNGYIFLAGAFPYLQGKYIRDILRARCPVPIAVENDANSAAIAELRSGALCGVADVVAVILGSSIGGAIIRNGEVYYGKHFSAAEFSLIKADSGDDSLHRLWRNINGKNGLLRLVQQSMKTEDVFDGIEIFDMANNGNQDVRNAIDEFCRLLAIQIYNVQAFADPEKIAIGGGISAQPLLFELLNKHLDRIFAQEANYGLAEARPDIAACKYRNNANLIGALYSYLDFRGKSSVTGRRRD